MTGCNLKWLAALCELVAAKEEEAGGACQEGLVAEQGFEKRQSQQEPEPTAVAAVA